jgi:hypothetical protein
MFEEEEGVKSYNATQRIRVAGTLSSHYTTLFLAKHSFRTGVGSRACIFWFNAIDCLRALA